MTIASVQHLYEKHYAGEKARRGFSDALAVWRQPDRVLYPGSFIHVTASLVFPSVVYVDNDRNAKRFFSKMDDVVSFVVRHKVYNETPMMAFHSSSYEADLPEPNGSFDLLISLYAGFISKPCKRYLKRGGILAVNNSHGDAGLASIDPDIAVGSGPPLAGAVVVSTTLLSKRQRWVLSSGQRAGVRLPTLGVPAWHV